MAWFNTPIVLLQPRLDDAQEPVRHERMCRIMRRTGVGVGDVEGAATNVRTWLVHVDTPPAGLGTVWTAELDGEPGWRINQSFEVPNRIRVTGLILFNSEPTGEFAP